MAPATDSRAIKPEEPPLGWSRWMSLTGRILAVNIFAIAMSAGSFFYLDSYRERVIEERLDKAEQTIWIVAHALAKLPYSARTQMLAEIGSHDKVRFRLYDLEGGLQIDSFRVAGPSYLLRDPADEPWERHAARFLDIAIDTVVGAAPIDDFVEIKPDQLGNWEEARRALTISEPIVMIRNAPDRTPMISAALALPGREGVLLMTYNARDVTRIVRAERFNLSLIILATTLISVLLSLFLARTIVRPLRRLARAAVRVRLGRAREVVVPRLPSRSDEIGMLARALSDMSLALRQKIDATEAFAADVSHELKNPIASLRSALEALQSVKDPALRQQLMDIAANDVRRLDRLITDVSEASRVDAQLTRTRFEPVDLGEMIEMLLNSRAMAGLNKGHEVIFARPRKGVAVVMGEGTRLERVISNLLDNAISFSPPDELVQIKATCAEDQILIQVIDGGPGVAESEREEIFRRFHSVRPDNEEFGQHSGLGLAIARTIIEGHHGSVTVKDREDGETGACFEVRLPAASDRMMSLAMA